MNKQPSSFLPIFLKLGIWNALDKISKEIDDLKKMWGHIITNMVEKWKKRDLLQQNKDFQRSASTYKN